MELDLVDHRAHFGLKQRAHVMLFEVGKADRADAARLVKLGHRAPGFEVDLVPILKPVRGGRPVNQI